MKGGDTLPRVKSRPANLVFEHKSVTRTLSVTPGSNIRKCNWLKDLIHPSAKKSIIQKTAIDFQNPRTIINS